MPMTTEPETPEPETTEPETPITDSECHSWYLDHSVDKCVCEKCGELWNWQNGSPPIIGYRP